MTPDTILVMGILCGMIAMALAVHFGDQMEGIAYWVGYLIGGGLGVLTYFIGTRVLNKRWKMTRKTGSWRDGFE